MNPEYIFGAATLKAAQLTGEQNLWAVEGNCRTLELRTASVAELCLVNHSAFAFAQCHGFVLLGLFPSRDKAEASCRSLRELTDGDKDTTPTNP